MYIFSSVLTSVKSRIFKCVSTPPEMTWPSSSVCPTLGIMAPSIHSLQASGCWFFPLCLVSASLLFIPGGFLSIKSYLNVPSSLRFSSALPSGWLLCPLHPWHGPYRARTGQRHLDGCGLWTFPTGENVLFTLYSLWLARCLYTVGAHKGTWFSTDGKWKYSVLKDDTVVEHSFRRWGWGNFPENGSPNLLLFFNSFPPVCFLPTPGYEQPFPALWQHRHRRSAQPWWGHCAFHHGGKERAWALQAGVPNPKGPAFPLPLPWLTWKPFSKLPAQSVLINLVPDSTLPPPGTWWGHFFPPFVFSANWLLICMAVPHLSPPPCPPFVFQQHSCGHVCRAKGSSGGGGGEPG